jgi:glycosyltransferase involved in cell wall biosynthesis
MKKYSSLCLLAYKRPQQLKTCINSLIATIDAPAEIIVNLDSDDSENSEYLFSLYKQKKISKLILNAGNNRGVGTSFAYCVGAAEGDYIFKIDTDLVFKPGWLSKAVWALEELPEIGAISLFDYKHYDPNETRFNSYDNIKDYLLVDDFVNSIYGFRKHWIALGGWEQDDGFHKKIQEQGVHLAITNKDYVENTGFGIGKTTYVSGTEENPFKTPTHDRPLIFHDTI